MSAVIAEYASVCYANDIHIYPLAGGGDTGDFVYRSDFLDPSQILSPVEWFIGNPPFGLADRFLGRALKLATVGVAFLLRMQWLETEGRYKAIYTRTPPTRVAQFVERVPMCEGGWDPKASTATAYAWFIWVRDEHGEWPRPRIDLTFPFFLIPPGCKKVLTRESDAELAARFVPGFVPPSTLRKSGKKQLGMELA
jgi:hypothetical protein